MNYIVVDAYSLYMAIVARPWLHVLGAISSTLHLKVKYLSRDQIKELVGSQSVARQCLIVAITHQPRGGVYSSKKLRYYPWKRHPRGRNVRT